MKYIAEEVYRQRDDANAVYWMLEAWLLAESDWHAAGYREDRTRRVISVNMIESWGKLVHPKWNAKGFRTVPVMVGGRRGTEPCDVAESLAGLVELCNTSGIRPEEAYYEFEIIHPFSDGNGRTGKIVFNYLRGTLNDPALPPNFWNCSNP